MLAISLLCSGCSLPERLDLARAQGAQARQRVEGLHEAHARRISDRAARLAAQDVARPWLAGRAQPLAREVVLPEPLRTRVEATLLYTDKPDLLRIAQRIRRATGIAVRVLPEALLPPAMFMPRLQGMPGAQADADDAGRQAELESGPQPLADLLDALAARLYVHWRYRANAIEFYRTDTRVFDVRMLALSTQTESRLGRAASGQAEGFDHSMQTSMQSGEGAPLQALRARILPFLSRAGVISEVAQGGNALVVTDMPDVLDRIDAYIARENRVATRRVRILLEELTVSNDANDERDIDWSGVFARAGRAFSLASPDVAQGTGAVASATIGSGAWSGSRAMLQALSEAGTVVRRRSIPLLTLNRQPVTHAVHNTFSYVDQVQGGAVGGTVVNQAVLPTVSVSQKRETVGTFVTIVPDARDDGSILLSIGYDNSYAQPLQALSFGPKDSALVVQQLNLDGQGTVQQVALRPGQAVLLAGFDRHELDAQSRRLAPGAPILAGGRDKLGDKRLSTVLLVTAQLEDGDA
ncbi:hypothetical protein ACILG0_20560 [Pseudomonadota bacterium AL_CKDN230030165-1A_HGKHYDSX7]